MNRFVLRAAITTLLLTPAIIWAQSTQPDQQQVEQLERDLHSNPQDVVSADFVEKHVAENYVWMTPGGELGRSELTKSEPGQKVTDAKVKGVRVHVVGDTAIVDGLWSKRTQDSRGGVKWEGIFQDVWMKQNGSWKLIASATSPFRHEKAGGESK